MKQYKSKRLFNLYRDNYNYWEKLKTRKKGHYEQIMFREEKTQEFARKMAEQTNIEVTVKKQKPVIFETKYIDRLEIIETDNFYIIKNMSTGNELEKFDKNVSFWDIDERKETLERKIADSK